MKYSFFKLCSVLLLLEISFSFNSFCNNSIISNCKHLTSSRSISCLSPKTNTKDKSILNNEVKPNFQDIVFHTLFQNLKSQDATLSSKAMVEVLADLKEETVNYLKKSPDKTDKIVSLLSTITQFDPNITIMLTRRCPFNCDFCSAQDFMKTTGTKDFPLKKLKEIISQLKNYPKMTFMGGEPFMYGTNHPNDFIDLLKFASKHVRKIDVVTNCFFLPNDQDQLNNLLDQIPDNVRIIPSIDSFHLEEMDKKGKDYSALLKKLDTYQKKRERFEMVYSVVIPANLRNKEQAILNLLKKFELDKKYQIHPDQFLIHTMIGQGGAASMTEIASKFEEEDLQKHLTPSELSPYIGINGDVFSSAHAAFMEVAPEYSILGNSFKNSVSYIFLNWALKTDATYSKNPKIKKLLEILAFQEKFPDLIPADIYKEINKIDRNVSSLKEKLKALKQQQQKLNNKQKFSFEATNILPLEAKKEFNDEKPDTYKLEQFSLIFKSRTRDTYIFVKNFQTLWKRENWILINKKSLQNFASHTIGRIAHIHPSEETVFFECTAIDGSTITQIIAVDNLLGTNRSGPIKGQLVLEYRDLFKNKTESIEITEIKPTYTYNKQSPVSNGKIVMNVKGAYGNYLILVEKDKKGNWTKKPILSSSSIYSYSFNEGKVVALTENGFFLVSENGKGDWEQQKISLKGIDIYKLKFSKGMIVGFGEIESEPGTLHLIEIKQKNYEWTFEIIDSFKNTKSHKAELFFSNGNVLVKTNHNDEQRNRSVLLNKDLSEQWQTKELPYSDNDSLYLSNNKLLAHEHELSILDYSQQNPDQDKRLQKLNHNIIAIEQKIALLENKTLRSLLENQLSHNNLVYLAA